MLNFLKNIFSQKRVNEKINKSVNDLILKTNRDIDSNLITKRKLKSLIDLNEKLSESANEMKIVSKNLIDKLNKHIIGLTTEIKAISNTTSDGIIVLDYKGQIINLNYVIEKTFGYELKQLLGENITKILPVSIEGYCEKTHSFQEVMESVSKNIFKNLKIKESKIKINVNEYFSLTKNNRKLIGKSKNNKNIFLEMNVNIINPNILSYEEIQYICIMKDITELTFSRKEIQDLVKFQLSLVEAIPNAVYWKDKNYRYVGCNSEFERISGFSRDEIIGKNT